MSETTEATRYLEDLTPGETEAYGSYTVTARDIVSFAKQFDPQPFHTDPERARETRHEGLIASGWHTACIAMRLAVLEGYLQDVAIVAGVGIDDLRWPNPVRPGDALSVREEFLEARASESDPSTGVLSIEIEVYNQDDDLVLSMVWIDLVERRQPIDD